jgi:hypothetical protein
MLTKSKITNLVSRLTFLILSTTTAFAEITIVTATDANFATHKQYTLSLTGNDAKALSSVLNGKKYSSQNFAGVELLTCATEDACTIKIGADVITRLQARNPYDCCSHPSIHTNFFESEVNSVFSSSNLGSTLSSPTSSMYLFAEFRKMHARSDKELFALLKKSNSHAVETVETEKGTKLTLASENLNLSCVKLYQPINFKHARINLGHMGSIGETSFNISYICQLNVKAIE